MSKKLIEISHDEELNRIFTKAHYLEEAEASLSEGSMKFLLVEKIGKAEVKKVSDALKGSREQISKIEKYLEGLKAKGLDLTKTPTITKMIKDMKDAIDQAQGDFASANFNSGKVSSFMGNKLTAPGIAKAAIAIQTKANQFLTGFTDALQNIEDNLVPLAKDDSIKNAPMRDIAGQGGIPDEAKLEKGIKAAITSALKPQGTLAKIKNFISKNMPTAQGKILKSLPDIDADKAAEELTDAIMSASLSVFDANDLKDTKVAMKDVGKIVQDIVTSEEGSGEVEAPTSGQSGSDPEPPASEKEAEEEQANAESELKDAVSEESKESQTPKEASLGALDAWVASLSKTSQASLKAAGRFDDLKDIVGTALDDSAQAVEGQVAAAISAWRDDHEETLIKGKRFAKKNFDELERLISTLAGNMLKMSNESRISLTNENIKKIVFKFLDRKFYKNYDSMIVENSSEYTEEALIIRRMNRMAGIE